jgi:hypothetical protein
LPRLAVEDRAFDIIGVGGNDIVLSFPPSRFGVGRRKMFDARRNR